LRADSFLTLFAALMKRKIKIKILLFSVKSLTNSEDCYKSRIKISVLASFPAVGQFFPEFSHYRMQEKSAKIYISPARQLSEQFSGSPPAFGTVA
jgi:hypothetical protein